MRYALFCLLAVASVLEYSSQGRFGIAMVTGLYFLLLTQADHAARRLLRCGLVFPAAPGPTASAAAPRRKITLEDVMELPRPGGARRPRGPTAAQGKQESQARPGPKPEAKKPAHAKPKPPEEPAKPQAPDFRGRPHEVLAVGQNAATQTIVRAFRHWVKQHHPDHARTPREAQGANERTRCLTDAKDKMLQRRKQIRKPGAA